MNVGENITLRMKELRKQHQLSLQQVADRAGTTKSHIWEMENGRSKNPTVEMAVSIANAFGVSLEYLTGLSSAMPDLHPEAMQVAFEIDAILRKVGCTTDQKDGIETAAKWHESEAEHYEAHAGDKDGIPFPIVAGWHRLNAERIRALAPADAGKVEGDGWSMSPPKFHRYPYFVENISDKWCLCKHHGNGASHTICAHETAREARDAAPASEGAK